MVSGYNALVLSLSPGRFRQQLLASAEEVAEALTRR